MFFDFLSCEGLKNSLLPSLILGMGSLPVPLQSPFTIKEQHSLLQIRYRSRRMYDASTGTNSHGGLIIERTPGRRKYVTAVTVTVTSMQNYELLVALARNQGSICDTHQSRRDHRKYPQRRDFIKYDFFLP